jgi:hypothetical protein
MCHNPTNLIFNKLAAPPNHPEDRYMPSYNSDAKHKNYKI